MNRLAKDRRVLVTHLLMEGMSMRAAERITDININTIMSLVLQLGKACEDYMDRTLLELPCTRIEVDEIWSYIHTKEDHLKPEERGGLNRGDSYTWIAIDPDSKLVPCWHVGKRTFADGQTFISNLASRMAGRIQITSDGFMAYKPEGASKEWTQTTGLTGSCLVVSEDRSRRACRRKRPNSGGHRRPGGAARKTNHERARTKRDRGNAPAQIRRNLQTPRGGVDAPR